MNLLSYALHVNVILYKVHLGEIKFRNHLIPFEFYIFTFCCSKNLKQFLSRVKSNY